MRAVKMNADQMRSDSGREYNPQVWNQNIDRYLKYEDVEFYKVAKGDGYEYDRYYVVYTLPEGLRLLSVFSYSSCITSGGFYWAMITDFVLKGKEIEMLPEGEVNITSSKQLSMHRDPFVIGTTPEAIEWMTDRSKQLGCIYTKELIS